MTETKGYQYILEQASDWFVELRDGDADGTARQQFTQWLRTSPQHVRAYLEIAAIWADVPSVDPDKKVSAEALIARARAERNIVDLGVNSEALSGPEGTQDNGPARASELTPARRGSSTRRRFLLAASVALAFIASAAAWWQLTRYPTYATGVGEQRSITLADGSTIDLNARSKVKVEYTEKGRTVELVAGQAMFQVAKDTTRPFIVRSDGTLVRAVGTQFDVYRREGGTTVTVVEGRVEVQRKEPPSLIPVAENGSAGATPSIFVSAGEQITVTRQAEVAPQPTRANVAAATAWTQRRLVFESSPLAEVAEEFNRYNVRQLRIDDSDEDIRNFHISGVFSSTDPTSLIRFLREQPGIRITETDTEIRITRQ